MAIPTVQAVGTANSGTTSAVTYTLPSHQADDILLLFVESGATGGVTAPSGWANITNSPRAQGSNVTCLNIFWLRATSGSTTNPATGAAANHQIGFAMVIRGAITSGNPWDFAPGGDGGTSLSPTWSTTGTTTVADCLGIVAACDSVDTATNQFSAVTNSSLSSFTQQKQQFTTNGNGGGIGVWTGGKASAGAISATTATIASAGSHSVLTFAIKPATAVTLSADGTIAVVSTLVGNAQLLAVASGTIPVVSTLVGNAQAKAVTSGTIPIVSTLVGNATKVLPEASGTIAVVSGQAGAVTARMVASGTIAVVSGQAGTVTARMVANGTVVVLSGQSGNPTRVLLTLAASGTIPAVSALQGTVTARLVASGAIPVVSGQSGNPTRVGLTLSASGTIIVISTLSGDASVVGGGVTYTVAGTIVVLSALTGNPTAIPAGPVVMLRLVLDRGRDEGGLPPDLWYHFSYPFTQTALLLFTDGRVIPTFTLEGPLYRSADAVAGGGYQSIYPSDSWEVDVLTDAGYTLEPVL